MNYMNDVAITEQSCLEEATKWYSRKDFETFSRPYYIFAKNNNLLDSYFWMSNQHKIDLTEEHCYREAKKYKYFDDFIKNSNKEYVFSKRHRLLKNMFWLELSPEIEEKKIKFLNEYLTKYDSLVEFSKHGGMMYYLALRYGWTEMFEREYNDNFTRESCERIAKKYRTISEFRVKEIGAYSFARKHGYLGDYTWLKREDAKLSEKRLWCVYSYEFRERKTAYVGLTRDITTRRRAHESGVTFGRLGNESSVYRFISENNLSRSEYKLVILKSKLKADEAQYYEDQYIIHYRNQGWKLLNKAKTGIKTGSLGGNIPYWTKDRCLEVAKTVNSKVELKQKYPSAYNNSLKYGWIEDYNWFIDPKCSPIIQYSLRGEFIQRFKSVNEASKTLGINRSLISLTASGRKDRKTWSSGGYIWRYEKNVLNEDGTIAKNISIDEAPSHRIEYTKDECEQIARQYKYISHFKHGNSWAYITSYRNGWLEEYTWFSTPSTKPIPIVCYDSLGNYIKECESIGSIERENNIKDDIRLISKSLKINKEYKSGEYIWRYKSDVLDENGEVLKKIEIDSGEKS